MTEHKDPYDDPTNCVICIFDDEAQSTAAKADLVAQGIDSKDIHLLQDKEESSEIDASPKWFADTDKIQKKFKRELRKGQSILSVALDDAESRELIHGILKKHNGRYVTHFGEWITETLR